MAKKLIFGVIAIIIVLVVAYFSQKAVFTGSGNTLISGATNQAKDFLSKGSDWVMTNIYPKISGEVQKRGDMIKDEVNSEKEKISESIGEKISNYFSGVTDSILHPGTPQNCESAQSDQILSN
jgi:predicted PurR-regulated permease PerM